MKDLDNKNQASHNRNTNSYRCSMQATSKSGVSPDCWSFLRTITRNIKSIDALIIGSTAELPLEYLLAMEHNFTVDQLKYHRDECAIPRDCSPTNDFNGTVYYIEPIAKQTGYATLNCSSTDYLSSATRGGLIPAGQICARRWSKNSRKRSGVLVENYDMNDLLLSQHPLALQLVGYKRFSMNIHTSIVCPHWPREASEWIKRKRQHGWPSEKLIESVTASGCHLVPCRKPGDEQHCKKTLFRYIFSLAESMLISTWNPVQKYIYHILLLIKKDVVKQLKARNHRSIIQTYHLKTLMLWACETRPAEFWEESRINSAVGELLCQMIEFLVEKSCPNYFISSSNLLENLSEDFDLEGEIAPLLVYKEQGASRLVASVPMSYPSRSTNLTISNKVLNIGYLGLRFLRLQSCNNITNASRSHRSVEDLPDPSEFVDLHRALSAHHLLVQHKYTPEIKGHAASYAYSNDLVKEVLQGFECAMTGKGRPSSQQCVTVRLGEALPEVMCSMAKLDICADTATIPTSNKENRKDLVCKEDEQYTIFGRISTQTESPSQSSQLQIEHEEKDERSSNFHTILSLCLNAILPTVDKQLPRPTYLVSAAFKANFYYTYLKDYQMALSVCEEGLRTLKSEKKHAVFYFNDQICSVVLSPYFMPLFDEHIQTVYGFVVLLQALRNNTRKSGRSSNIPAPNDRKFADKASRYISPSDFLQYIKLQCEKRMVTCSSYVTHESVRQLGYTDCSTRRSPEILFAAFITGDTDRRHKAYETPSPFWCAGNLLDYQLS